MLVDVRDGWDIGVYRRANDDVRIHDNTIIIAMAKSERKRDPLAFDDSLAEQRAWLMDSWIDLGPISIGLDGIIGLIPGIGDVLGSMVGVWIVARAMKHGVPRPAILRMLVNLGIDGLVGAI